MAARVSQPRQHLERPDWFGKHPDAKWNPPGKQLTEQAEVAAAYHQHLAACQVRRILDEQRIPVPELARELSITADTFRRKLRGEAWVRYDELLAWVLALGIDILPAPDSTDDLTP